ncbi:MAG: hypothetical protein HN875_00400 [Candidatus Nitrosopelagicus sp.]|jgi:hypothetical protein|nr:hypothetical protein [Candidatus Nitrosopelagicus sp.]
MNAKYNSRKGRKLQKLVAEKILKTFRHLKKSDVHVAGTGVNGPDLVLSRIAKRLIPYQFECKAQNRLKTVWQWKRQSEKNTNLDGVVVMKSNGKKPLVVIDMDLFFDLIK